MNRRVGVFRRTADFKKLIGLGVGSLLALILVAMVVLWPDREPLDAVRELEDRGRSYLLEWLRQGALQRDDGFVYGVDVGQTLAYAARARDTESYERLSRLAKERLVRDELDDPYTSGFVYWRVRDGVAPDASGTTEALRVAEGLLAGSEAFGRPDDREVALLILDGYRRHAAVDKGVWFIRNYFNFGTRAFAVNSFLVDYDVDLVDHAATLTEDALLKELASQCADVVESSVAPCGILYDLIQPEIKTLMPDFGTGAFSPNDVVQLSNTLTVVERSVTRHRALARTVVDFARAEGPWPKLYYYGRTGEPARSRRMGVEGLGPLIRLAIKLEDRSALGVFWGAFEEEARRFLDGPFEPRLYLLSEILLTLEAARTFWISPPRP